MQHLRLLCGRRAARREAGSFVVEGPKLLAEALRAGSEVEAVYVEQGGAGPEVGELTARAARAGARILETAPGVLTRACDAVSAQSVAAVVRGVEAELADLAGAGPGPVVVCVDLQDPGNAGTILRSAAASGAAAVVFCSGAVDVYNPKVVRASAGAVFHVPVVTGTPAEEALDELGRWGRTRIATAARGGRPYDRADLTRRCALVLGGESRGLPATLSGRLDETVTIPMVATSESLNVAMAATIVCFEAARQRRAGAGREQA